MTAKEFKHNYSKFIPLGEELMHFRASKEVYKCMIEFAINQLRKANMLIISQHERKANLRIIIDLEKQLKE